MNFANSFPVYTSQHKVLRASQRQAGRGGAGFKTFAEDGPLAGLNEEKQFQYKRGFEESIKFILCYFGSFQSLSE